MYFSLTFQKRNTNNKNPQGYKLTAQLFLCYFIYFSVILQGNLVLNYIIIPQNVLLFLTTS